MEASSLVCESRTHDMHNIQTNTSVGFGEHGMRGFMQA